MKRNNPRHRKANYVGDIRRAGIKPKPEGLFAESAAELGERIRRLEPTEKEQAAARQRAANASLTLKETLLAREQGIRAAAGKVIVQYIMKAAQDITTILNIIRRNKTYKPHSNRGRFETGSLKSIVQEVGTTKVSELLTLIKEQVLVEQMKFAKRKKGTKLTPEEISILRQQIEYAVDKWRIAIQSIFAPQIRKMPPTLSFLRTQRQRR